jgi:hypothetical protein
MPAQSILHIGDSISKLGVYVNIGSWLQTNYPSINYNAVNINNNGVVGVWAGSFWEWFGKFTVDIMMCNSGMWDRSYSDSVYQDKLTEFFRTYKSLHPKTRIVWASTTDINPSLVINPNYAVESAAIISHNAIAVAILDTVYGSENWDYVNQHQFQLDNYSSIPFADGVHPTAAGYALYSQNWELVLGGVIDGYAAPLVPAVKQVAYGVCYNGVADFKTGAPTVSIASGLATFSIAQSSLYMGVGAEIQYNDGNDKKCYVKPLGKISEYVWAVSDSVGISPADCTGATISVIKHPFTSLALACSGHVGATYLNSTDRRDTGVDAELHLACYINQTTFDRDESGLGEGNVVLNQSTGDFSHKLYIYAPTNTSTECNAQHGITKPTFDATKYTLAGSATVFRKNTLSVFCDVSRLQIYHTSGATSTVKQCISISPDTSFDWCRFSRNIIISTTNATSTQQYRALYIGVSGGGTYVIDNNIILGIPGAGTNSAGAITTAAAGISVYIYNNTFYGDYLRPITRTTGTVTSANNIFLGMAGAISGAVTKNYDVYNIDESEADGTLTTQADADFFADVSAPSILNWDYTPKKYSDAIGAGYVLGYPYSCDIGHQANHRSNGGNWDCGAVAIKKILKRFSYQKLRFGF